MRKRIRHFIGRESSEQLAFIDELHALGLSNDVELPELVVLGDQNTGKSSVLQAITEINFPVKDTMCTRFPIRISFRQTPASKKPTVKVTLIPGLLSEKDDALVSRAANFSFEKEELTEDVMAEIIREATECIFPGQTPAKQTTLSDTTLSIERSGTEEMHWTIVDLPGLIRKGKPQDVATAEGLARRYLENERNIVLRPTSQELGVGRANTRVAEPLYWDLDEVRLQPKEMNVSDKERDELERKEFGKSAWEGVAHDRAGIKSLMDYVDKERRTQLQKGIPLIVDEIRQKLQECENDLKKSGEARNTPRAQRYYVLQFCNEMQKMAESTLRGEKRDIPSNDPNIMLRYKLQRRLDQFAADIVDIKNMAIYPTKFENDLHYLSVECPNSQAWEEMLRTANVGLYAEIYKEAEICRGRSLPGNVHPDVEEKIFRKLSSHWERIARAFVKDAKDCVKDCYDLLLRIAIPNSKVRLEVSRIVGKRLEEWNTDTDLALQALIEDNQSRPLITTNPILLEQTKAADWQRDQILLRGSTRNKPTSTNPAVEKEGKGDASSENHQNQRFVSTMLSQVLFVAARLSAYHDIAVYRFVDNVAMQVVERHVLGPKCPMRTVSADIFAQLDDSELNTVAGEDEADSRARMRLERARDRYRQAMEKWDRLRVL
ncbi:putative dynamin family GTPase [Aspergillus tanneri]|uniref:GED domain-containing protein n=1 Tax=Aspergillus tanneri TaxID=1220188 RepID=A0A5M9MJB0_9EURO|nr:uncharacterized protein ATNIH1004_006849 [Aspergillus tanneri]KAA8645430.1 hypothetical protein ATNIH1004_006849 [Aspergillus tanneri]